MQDDDYQLNRVQDKTKQTADKVQDFPGNGFQVRKCAAGIRANHVNQELCEINQLLDNFTLVECVKNILANFRAHGLQIPGHVAPGIDGIVF